MLFSFYFQAYVELRLLSSQEQLLNSSGVLSAGVGDQLKQLQAFLDLLLSFGDCYLKEFLAISKTVCVYLMLFFQSHSGQSSL